MEIEPENDGGTVTSEFFARCPHCEAVFRVGEQKLQLRQGKVRCGACREVFNALEHQVVRNQLGIFQRLARSQQNTPDESAESSAEEAESPASMADVTDELAQPDAAARKRPLREILERNLDELNSDSRHSISRAFQREPDEVPVRDEGAATGLFADDVDQQPVDEQPHESRVESDRQSGRDHWFKAEPDPALDNNPFADRSSRSTSQAAAGSGSFERQGPSQINMQGVDEYIMDRPNPLVGFFWFLVAVGFVVLLGVQVKYYFVDRFAQDERYRPYLSLFCKVASCELQPRRDAYRFTITNTRIDLHPAEPGALRITVKLLNQAEFPQPYPDLQLTLTDRVGRVVGRRSFEPSFFLEPYQANQLGSGALGSVVFDLAHPHEKAVGFVVDIVHTRS